MAFAGLKKQINKANQVSLSWQCLIFSTDDGISYRRKSLGTITRVITLRTMTENWVFQGRAVVCQMTLHNLCSGSLIFLETISAYDQRLRSPQREILHIPRRLITLTNRFNQLDCARCLVHPSCYWFNTHESRSGQHANDSLQGVRFLDTICEHRWKFNRPHYSGASILSYITPIIGNVLLLKADPAASQTFGAAGSDRPHGMQQGRFNAIMRPPQAGWCTRIRVMQPDSWRCRRNVSRRSLVSQISY